MSVTIESLRSTPPAKLLQIVENTPYPLQEKVWDAFYFAKNFLLNGVFENPYSQCKNIFINIYSSFDDTCCQNDEITKETVESHCSERFGNMTGKTQEEGETATRYKTNLHYVLDNIARIAGQVGLSAQPTIRISLDIATRGFSGYNFRWIELGCCDLERSTTQEIEFLLAHELSHIKHYDYLKKLIFDCCNLALQLFSTCYFAFSHTFGMPQRIALAIGAPLLIKGIGWLICHKMSCYREHAADLRALSSLNSAQGMAAYIRCSLRLAYSFKNFSVDEILEDAKQNGRTLTRERIMTKKNGHRVDGTDRGDTDHPRDIERLRRAVNFKPVVKG